VLCCAVLGDFPNLGLVRKELPKACCTVAWEGVGAA
jgi:hypothetical protein